MRQEGKVKSKIISCVCVRVQSKEECSKVQYSVCSGYLHVDRTGPSFFCRMAGPVVLVLVSHDMREDVSGDGDVLDRAHTQRGERLPSSISIWHAFVSHAERGRKVLGGR